ncbi:MAG: hypothetical protein ACRED0_09280 [Gammaproteobacteria bacterium]
MRKKIVVALAVAVLMSQDIKSEPQVLTASQMDEVTASGVFVDVLSLASGQGDSANVSTYTHTHIVTTPWIEVGFGVSIARAVACCGPDAEVEVASEGIGAGDRVLRRTHGVVRHSPRFAHAVSVVTVVVISRATPAEIRAGLAEHGSFSGGAKMVSAR